MAREILNYTKEGVLSMKVGVRPEASGLTGVLIALAVVLSR